MKDPEQIANALTLNIRKRAARNREAHETLPFGHTISTKTQNPTPTSPRIYA
jgi:hypothetical protein